MIAAMLGHALIATEKPANFAEAKQVLKTRSTATMKIRSPGISSASSMTVKATRARAALATAERNNLEGNPKLALASAKMAMRGIPKARPTIFARRTSPWCPRNELKKKEKRQGEPKIRRGAAGRGDRRRG